MPSRWKPRDPSIFPVAYTDTVQKALSNAAPAFLSSHRDEYSARMAADRFREWRFCLRSSGSSLHRAFTIERDFRITLRTVNEDRAWEIWVGVKPRIERSIARLNPNLADLLTGICQ